ncbi:MAG TPA: universal stress protein [Pseudomonadales bacterium]
MAYSNILIAIDLSEESREVLDAAKVIASRTSARLHLLTVIKPLSHVYGGLDMAPISSGTISFEEEAAAQARQQLQTLAQEYGIKPGDVHVVLGAPGPTIRELAAETKADLIVLGSHGRHGFSLLLGSTANAVLHDAGCNVLAVRLQYD